MCTTCGCGIGQTLIAGHALKQPRKPGEVMRYRVHEDGAALAHPHTHQHNGLNGVFNGALDFGTGAAGTHAPGISQSRMIKIERDILSKNNDYAAENRDTFSTHGIFALNLVSSPGSGKTTLLVKTIAALHGTLPIAVIEGDQQTDNDAARIRAAGAPALQINTGKGCHLDAYMVGQAMQQLHLQNHSLLLIENVGNLVCPASFDLGEAHKVVILSVTEGEDKPLKYPDMFRVADLMLLNKCDLLPYLEFDAELAVDYARRINPKLKVIRISATSGEGMTEWLDWIAEGCRNAVTAVKRSAEPKILLE
ncbi:hydrogenase nickel incorporation protein HypB [Candidatus Nitrotoga sp. BS]|uniref:hydrogenase nickel incorporation protein HypB n=1 Tax=Candidatus Nitrotoga sp. BS TaxID=2890408 RepID=UPI001EF1629C|nr:hydrogenase nickel incorporation protein HypB [Candidatus Nitrotoga sp. BS]CAH1192242.1 hydrogenase nickel incorporation protein HypB [Candidatus Nitrotoga sp. BS]